MIEVIKKGKPVRILFRCPVCGCEFLTDMDDVYRSDVDKIRVRRRGLVVRITYEHDCPNCKYECTTVHELEGKEVT